MQTDLKKKAILNRIKSIEGEILKAQEYLETGEHAHWHGFKPLFNDKYKDGKKLRPHKDWVRNVFLPSRIRALKKAEKLLDRIE